jgi:hypothetical protein
MGRRRDAKTVCSWKQGQKILGNVKTGRAGSERFGNWRLRINRRDAETQRNSLWECIRRHCREILLTDGRGSGLIGAYWSGTGPQAQAPAGGADARGGLGGAGASGWCSTAGLHAVVWFGAEAAGRAPTVRERRGLRLRWNRRAGWQGPEGARDHAAERGVPAALGSIRGYVAFARVGSEKGAA